MRISKILINNRKRVFIITVQSKQYEFSYTSLRLVPSRKNPVVDFYIDKDLSGEGFTYKLKNGKSDTVLLDQVLFENRDPDLIREHLLYELSVKATKLIKAQKIPKRVLARRLAISPTQLYRLLDQTFYGKTIDQMMRLMSALGQSVEFRIRKVV